LNYNKPFKIVLLINSMKNLWNKIKTPIKVGALTTILSLLPMKSMGQEVQDSTSIQTESNIPMNYGFASIGPQFWADTDWKEIYGHMIMFKGGYQRYLTKDVLLDLSANLGSRKNETDYNEYELSNASLNLGLSKYFLLSDDNKIALYVNGGLKVTAMREEIKSKTESTALGPAKKTENGSTAGYYIGGGLEIPVGRRSSWFVEISVNESTLEWYGGEANIGGVELTSGIKFF